jgi:predicted nuclease of predicted toxin-antitoxin system
MAESLKFFADENIAGPIAPQLRNKGVDIVRCQEVGLQGASDEEIFAYSVEHNLIVITQDTDFLSLSSKRLESGLEHPAVFYLEGHVWGDKGIGVVVKAVLEFHNQVETGEKTSEDFYNRVIYVK